MSNGPVLETANLRKTFQSGDSELVVLDGIDFSVAGGEIVSIVGASGVGKSTLLHVIGTLLRPSSGGVLIGGKDVFGLPDQQLSRFRNRRIGFVFQFHHLLPEFSAEENVMLPVLIGGGARGAARERAVELLDSVSLADRSAHYPAELSGGEQQRVAVARALAASPEIVLADEPSGNLDDRSSADLHDLIWTLRERFGQAFVLVTHDEALADRADRKLRLAGGLLADAERGSPGDD